MKAIKGTREMVAEGRRLEQAGDLPEAAAVYQKAVDHDGGDQEAVGRLLVVYRKLKEYGKELTVIKEALSALEQRDKALQDKWIQAHPKAAGVGRAMFRKLGGAGASTSGADPVVNGLLKRKAFVEKRLGGGKMKKGAIVRRIPVKGRDRKKEVAAQRREKDAARKAAEKNRKEEAAAARQRADEQRKQKAEARKAEKQAAEKAKAERRPSLFVVSLRYLVPLEEIDTAMPRHMTFLDKHYGQGDFLVSGRQVPRTGGIIITRGKNRAAVERMMQSDPFVKGKMASIDIVEFSASQMGKGLDKTWLEGRV
jgi:uncharacterized protein YciI